MWRLCFAIFLLSGAFCVGADALRDVTNGQSDVSLERLHEVVDSLLDHHLGKRQIDASILRRSRQNMITLFDKNRLYLLFDEVSPFTTDNDSTELLAQYNEGSFDVYAQILLTIQNSILRSRKIRSGFFFTDLKSIEVARAAPPKEYSSFADTLDALGERIFRQFLAFVAHRLPEGKENDPEEVRKAVAVAEKEFEEAEKSWLTMSALGEEGQSSSFARVILRSIVLSLDAHSDILSESGAKATRERLSKEAFGSGIICSVSEKGCRVTKVVKGSPADRLGEVLLNDEISQIDGRNISEMTDEEISTKFEDETNEVLSLTVVRSSPGEKNSILHVSIPKRHYVLEEGRLFSEIRSTPYGNILILNLYCFYHGKEGVSSQEDVKRAIRAAKARGALGGIILDLRDNGGGYITEAVRVVGLFIKTGVVMESVYSDGTCLVFRDLDPNQEFSGPIIVLTSVVTASAAEIVAQALKDYGKAIVVGDPLTYGKGSIQMQTVTDVTEKGVWVSVPMRMTIGNFYTVSGFCPQGIGVKADIVLPSCSVRRAIEEPIVGSKSTVGPMFQDTLGDIKMQTKGWYQEHYVPFIEQPTASFRNYIPQLRRKSFMRVDKDPLFSLLMGNAVRDMMSEKIQQQVRWRQLDEAVFIMKDLLEETSATKTEEVSRTNGSSLKAL